MKKSQYENMKKEKLVELLLKKDMKIDHLNHIIRTIDVDNIAKHLSGDPDEYITIAKKEVKNNYPVDIPIPF